MVNSDEPLLLHYKPYKRLGWGYRNRLEDPADLDQEPQEPEDHEPPEAPEEPGRAPGQPQPRRPRSRATPRWTIWLPLVVAVVLGFAAGYATVPAAVLLVGGVAFVAIALRLEWAALLVVSTSVFEDYLAKVDARAIKAIAALLVLSWLIRRCRGRLHRSHRSPVMVATLAFVVALLAATAVHNNGTAGLDVVIRYAGFLAALIVLADVVRAGVSPERLARAYVAACAVAAVCGLLTFGLGLDRRVGGPVGDPNDFAFFLLPAVAMALALRRTVRRRWLWDIATIVTVLGILGTLSRGALLGLAVAGVVALATRMVRLRAAVGLAIVVAAAAFAVFTIAPGLVSTSLEQKDAVAGRNVSERLQLWEAAGRMTLEHPVLGVGPGGFQQRYRDYVTGLPDDINHPLDVSHNTWLELSSELGLAGLGAFLAMVATSLWVTWSAWRRRGDRLAAALCTGLAGTVATATFVTEQYYLPFWLIFALAVGVSSRPEPEPPTEEGR